MNFPIKPLLVAALVGAAAHASAQVTFYEGEGFHGRAFSTVNGNPASHVNTVLCSAP